MLRRLFIKSSEVMPKDYWHEIVVFSGHFKEEKEIQELSANCVEQIKQKWLSFNQQLKFKSSVSLAQIITGFMTPMREYVNSSYPILLSTGDALFILMVFSGIQKSGFVPVDSIEKAASELRSSFKFL